MKLTRWAFSVLFVVTTLLATVAPTMAKQTTLPGVSGNSYTSPQFGYSVSWDQSWTATDSTSETGTDSLSLDNRTSNLFIDGTSTTQNLQQCIDTSATQLAAGNGISDVAPSQGQSGVLAGGDSNQQWAVYDFNFTGSSGAVAAYRVIFQCFTNVAGQSQIVLTGYIPADSYSTEISAYQAVASTLVLNPAATQPQTQPTVAAPQPTATTATSSIGTGTTGISGNSYTSPEFGYSLSWDATWTPTETTADGHDQLRLDNGTSFLYFDGYAVADTIQECMDTEYQTLISSTGVTDVVQATNADGQPMGSTGTDSAWAVYDFTLTTDTGTTGTYSAYIVCTTVEPGVSQLVIRQLVPSDSYNDEIDARNAVIDTISLPAATTTTTEPTAQPTSGTTVGIDQPQSTTSGTPGVAADGLSYASPQFGYGLSWDSTWSVQDAASDPTGDFLAIDNGSQTLTFFGSNSTDDPAACLAGQEAILTGTTGVSGVGVATSNGTPIQQVSADLAYAVYDYVLTTDDGTAVNMSLLVECMPIQPGQSMLVVTQIVSDADYNDQIPFRKVVLDTLSFGAVPAVQPTQASVQEPATNLGIGPDGLSYVAPNFGYSLNWDSTWTAESETVMGEYDYLTLTNGASILAFSGTYTDVDTQTCLDQEVRALSATDGVTNAQVATTEGNPLQGVDPTFAFAVYDFQFTNSAGVVTSMSKLIECEPIVPGGSMLVVTQIVSDADYNDQLTPRKTVLDTLVIPEPSARAPEAPAAKKAVFSRPVFEIAAVPLLQDESQDSGVTGSQYASPQFGYTLHWDATWSVSDQSTEPGHDLLSLDNGTSSLYIEGVATTANPGACLQDQEDLLTTTSSISGVTVSAGTEGPMTSVSDTDAFAVYDFVYTSSDGSKSHLTEFVQCTPIVAGESMLVVSHLVQTDSYNEQVPARQAVLATIQFGGQPGTTTPAEETVTPETAGAMETFIQNAFADINNFWTIEYPKLFPGQTYTPPTKLVIYGADDLPFSTGCGMVSDEAMLHNAFYCPGDNIMYISLVYANENYDKMGLLFPVAATVAHEMGHHIQALMGLKTCDISPCLDPTEATSQETETMADCFLGAWARDAEARQILGDFDIESAVIVRATIGDNSEGGNPDAHGDGPLRSYWFLAGYYFGSPACLNASAVTSVGDSSQGANAPEEPTPVATTVPVVATVSPVAIGESFKVGTYTMTVTSAEQAATLPGGQAATGKYVVVYFSVTSDGTSPALFDFSSLLLSDANQQGYLADDNATNALLMTAMPAGTSTQLQPGVTYNLAVVYDVPADASGFMVQQTDGSYPVPLGF